MNKISCVLLIEDDPIAKFIAMKAIKINNLIQEIKACNNGKEAIDFLTSLSAINKPCPELIFLDINMPLLEGDEFLNCVKDLPFTNIKSVIFCVITNSSHPSDIIKIKSLGVHEYLIKPLHREAVEKIYEKYFNN